MGPVTSPLVPAHFHRSRNHGLSNVNLFINRRAEQNGVRPQPDGAEREVKRESTGSFHKLAATQLDVSSDPLCVASFANPLTVDAL